MSKLNSNQYQNINNQLLRNIQTQIDNISHRLIGTSPNQQQLIDHEIQRVLDNMRLNGSLQNYQVEVDPVTMEVTLKITPSYALQYVHANIALDPELSTEVLDIINGNTNA